MKTIKTSPALSLQASFPNTPSTMDTIRGTLDPTLLVIYIDSTSIRINVHRDKKKKTGKQEMKKHYQPQSYFHVPTCNVCNNEIWSNWFRQSFINCFFYSFLTSKNKKRKTNINYTKDSSFITCDKLSNHNFKIKGLTIEIRVSQLTS